MAKDDELERLLREVDALTNRPSGAAVPASSAAAQTSAAEPPAVAGKRPARASWTMLGAAGGGAAGAATGALLTLLPGFDLFSTGLGGAIGGAVLAWVSGAPDWFAKRRG